MTNAEKAVAVASYERKAALYRRIGTIYASTGFASVSVVFLLAIGWYLYSHGSPLPTWLDTTVGVTLLITAPVVVIGKLIRVFWWPVLEDQRQWINREIGKS